MGPDCLEDSGFQSVINTALELFVVTEEELSRYFNMSRVSVGRWKSGRNLPHPVLRRAVVDWINAHTRSN